MNPGESQSKSKNKRRWHHNCCRSLIFDKHRQLLFFMLFVGASRAITVPASSPVIFNNRICGVRALQTQRKIAAHD